MRLSSITKPWAVGADETADGVCSIFRVNTGLRDRGPGTSYRTAVHMTFAFEETDATGMPTAPAAESLATLEHRMVAVLGKSDEAVLSSVVTTAERGRTFCFYTATADGLTAAVARVVGPYRGEVRSVRHGEDPEWRIYREQLDHALAGEADIRIVQRLQAAGVDVRAPRMVDHVLLFPDRAAAERVVAGPLGAFSTSGPEEASDGRFIVELHLEQTVQFAPLAEARRWLKGICAQFDGVYDGWGTALDPDPPPSGT